MAQIDLKHAIVYIKDGSLSAVTSGAVNHAGGYTTGATTMVVDTITGAVAVGQTFTVVGETGTPAHTVTAHTETSTDTTGITFTPAIVGGTVADNAVITFTSTGGNILEVKIGEGNLTYNEKRNMEYKLNRGIIDTVREGDEVPLEVSLDYQWEYLSSSMSEPPTIEEVLKKSGNASGWISSSADPCEPYSVDILVRYYSPCTGIQDEKILLKDFRWESLDHNLKDGTVSVKGNCNVKEADTSRVDRSVGNHDLPRDAFPRDVSTADSGKAEAGAALMASHV